MKILFFEKQSPEAGKNIPITKNSKYKKQIVLKKQGQVTFFHMLTPRTSLLLLFFATKNCNTNTISVNVNISSSSVASGQA